MQFSNRSNISNTIQDMVRTYNDQMVNAAYQQYRRSQPNIPSGQSLTYQNTTQDMINREMISIIYNLIRKIQQEKVALPGNSEEKTMLQEEIVLFNEGEFAHTSTDLSI